MLKLSLLCSLLTITTCSQADINTNFSGFIGGTLPIVDVPIGKKEYYDFGLLNTTDWNEHFSTLIQLNYRGDERIEDVLTFGFASWNDTINEIPYTLSIGKFRWEHGLYGGVLTNPRTRPEILPPQSIYLHGLKYNIRSAYGVKADIFLGDFEFSASWGKPIVANENLEFFTWLNLPIDFVPLPYEQKRLTEDWGGIYMMFIKHQVDWNTFKMGYGQMSIGDFIGVEHITIGDELRYKDFTISAEAMLVNPHESFTRGVSIDWSDYDKLSKGVSFSASYTYEDFKFYANYNYYESQSPLPHFIPKEKSEWDDKSIGVMYNFTDNLMLRAEYHFIEGSRMIPTKESLTSSDYDNFGLGIVGITYFFD